MLQIQNLSVAVEQKTLLVNVSLHVLPGQVHIIMGPNGSGKSSLIMTTLGHPHYQIVGGDILFDGSSLQDNPTDARVRHGIFATMQQPPAIPGLSLQTFLQEMYRACTGENKTVQEFEKYVYDLCVQIHMDPAFLVRSVNEGFSGGERKRCELLQLLIARPRLALLDELDSGLDTDAVMVIINALAALRVQRPAMAIVCVTHYPAVARLLQPHYIHILSQGKLAKSGGLELLEHIESYGYVGI